MSAEGKVDVLKKGQQGNDERDQARYKEQGSEQDGFHMQACLSAQDGQLRLEPLLLRLRRVVQRVAKLP